MGIKVKQFQDKRKQWIHCFSGEDRNSIINQISQMVWDAAIFKIINESRRIGSNSTPKHEINGMIHGFIDKGFFNNQLLAVRRLSDTYPLEGERGVYSLVALINDLKQNVQLMTRSNFFADEGLEYDYEIILQKEKEYFREHTKNGTGALFLPKEVNSYEVQRRHRELDVLMGVDEATRTSEDMISEQVLDFLIKKINMASENINLHVKKNIAHAASPKSREYANVEAVALTLGHLWDSHKTICQVANFIDMYIVSRASHSFMPTPQYDHLENIEKPLVFSENIDLLNEAWHDFKRETDSWSSWGLGKFKEELDGE